jgi:hypothetical protein
MTKVINTPMSIPLSFLFLNCKVLPLSFTKVILKKSIRKVSNHSMESDQLGRSRNYITPKENLQDFYLFLFYINLYKSLLKQNLGTLGQILLSILFS